VTVKLPPTLRAVTVSLFALFIKATADAFIGVRMMMLVVFSMRIGWPNAAT
jgi:hypothetical protein